MCQLTNIVAAGFSSHKITEIFGRYYLICKVLTFWFCEQFSKGVLPFLYVSKSPFINYVMPIWTIFDPLPPISNAFMP